MSLRTGIEESKKNKQNKGLLGKFSIRYRRCCQGTASGFQEKGDEFSDGLAAGPSGHLLVPLAI
jgi:hypothetical protein